MAVFLTLLPLWLVGSSAVGLWLWHRGQQVAEEVETAKFRRPVEVEGLAEDLRKIVEIAGPRHLGSERGTTGLRRTAAMIQGTLGPENAGYVLELVPGPETSSGSWPLVLARTAGRGKPVALVAGYDSAGGPGVERNGTGLASVLALAQSMAGEEFGRPVVFAFVPHANDPEAPVVEVLDRLMTRLGDVEIVLAVESMGLAPRLFAASRDTGLLPRLEGRVRIAGAGTICLGEDADPASVLFQMGAPAVRVSTLENDPAPGPDDRLPEPEVHAAATRELAALVRSLAGMP